MITKRHKRRHKRDGAPAPLHRVAKPIPSPTTAEPIVMSSGDKDRTTELQNRVTAYQNTTPTDD
jgi:hypothetical protein